MKLETAQFIQNVCDIDIRENYSGRGGYKGVGFTTEESINSILADLMEHILEEGITINDVPKDFLADIRSIRSDNMGKYDTIYY